MGLVRLSQLKEVSRMGMRWQIRMRDEPAAPVLVEGGKFDGDALAKGGEMGRGTLSSPAGPDFMALDGGTGAPVLSSHMVITALILLAWGSKTWWGLLLSSD